MMRTAGTLEIFAESTKARCPTCNADTRSTRTVCGRWVITNTSNSVGVLGPIAASTAMASSSGGIDSTMSMMRISAQSTHPPR